MQNPDTEKVFRNLVNNIYMPDFDYLETKFAFRTVFHKDLYSYCMCRCGYEHELFDYIAPTTGEVNQEKFEHVLKCILEGKCPHITSQVPEEYVKGGFLLIIKKNKFVCLLWFNTPSQQFSVMW